MLRKVLRVGLVSGLVLMVLSCAAAQKKREIEKKTAKLHYQMGAELLGKGEYGKSLSEFRKAESIQPRDPAIQNALGLAYYYTKKYDEAEEAYRAAIFLKADFPEAYVNLGSLLARQEKYEEAIEAYRKALNDPFYGTPALALYNIGLCYGEMGKPEEAESAFLESLQQDQNMIQAYFDLGRLYYRTNEMEKAIENFHEAVERHGRVEDNPSNALSLASVHYWLALSYFKNGDSKRAVNHFQEVTGLTSHSELAEEALKYLDLLQ
jgi:type IV pilus assembly protein PilF